MSDTASIGAAKADYFPSVSISGLLGLNAATLGAVGDGQAYNYNLGASIAWTVFDFGRIRSRVAQNEARADAALARYQQAVDTWGQGPDQGDPDLAAHAAYADWLASRVTHMVRGDVPTIGSPFVVATVDDDVGGPYKVGPRDVFTQQLREAGMLSETGKGERGSGRRVVLVYAEPRSWKGRADLGARSLRVLRRLAPQAALVVLFAHPRLAPQVPGNAPVLCCWHGQPLMQRAAARWVIEKSK